MWAVTSITTKTLLVLYDPTMQTRAYVYMYVQRAIHGRSQVQAGADERSVEGCDEVAEADERSVEGCDEVAEADERSVEGCDEVAAEAGDAPAGV